MKRLIPIWFDIDGTLLHTRAGHAAFRNALYETFGWEARLEEVVFAGNTDLRVLLDLAHRHEGTSTRALAQQAGFFARMAAHLDAGLQLEKPELVPGAGELLRVLHDHPDVVLGLITGNARDCAFHKLRHAGLDLPFSHGGFGDEDPDRNVLAQRAREQMCLHLPEPCDLADGWVIGDTPRDVAAAKTIGARCLGVASGAYTAEVLVEAGADHVVSELRPSTELLDLLLG
jgi:phosphoglycolate phosphatase